MHRWRAYHRGFVTAPHGGVLATSALQVAATADDVKRVIKSDPSLTAKGELMEIVAMTSVALRFGGRPLRELVRSLDPSCDASAIPDWCGTHMFPGPDLVVGTMDALSGRAGSCCSSYFADPDRYASRGLLPVNTMGPGKVPLHSVTRCQWSA
jgi:hypothetical protein